MYIAGKEGWSDSGSWFSVHLFLESDLKLDELRLDGVLSNYWNEAWSIHDIDKDEYWAGLGRFENRPSPELFLKHRVERFVVHGGDFLLPLPVGLYSAVKDSPCERFGSKMPGDASWHFGDKILGCRFFSATLDIGDLQRV